MLHVAALYLRFSGDDSNDNDESKSLENQYLALSTYAYEHNITIYKTYQDLTKTGTNLNREGLINLLNDMHDKKFNTIIVKDLSRFSRNYLEAGKYLEEIFPNNNIRFISVNDNYDSLLRNNDDIPFKNYLNTIYSRDIKRKVKQALDIKGHQKKLIKIPRYGYIKDNGILKIDEEASKIIKRIYEEARKGLTPTQIANNLKNDYIYTPSFYKLMILHININKNKENVINNPYNWNARMIKSILTTKEYTGIAINHVNGKEIVLENNHEAIISLDDYNNTPKAYSKIVNHNRSKSYLNKLIYCRKCSFALSFSERKNKCDNLYYCPKCHKKIKANLIENNLYNDAYKLIKKASLNSNKLLEELRLVLNIKTNLPFNKEDLILETKKAFEKKLANTISDAKYKMIIEEIEEKYKKLFLNEQEKNNNEIKLNELKKKYEEFINNLEKEYFLNRFEMIRFCIEKCYVTFKDKEIEVEIRYKFSL